MSITTTHTPAPEPTRPPLTPREVHDTEVDVAPAARSGSALRDTPVRVPTGKRAMAIGGFTVGIGALLLLLPFLVPYGWMGQELAAIASWSFGVLLVIYGGARLSEAASVRRYTRSLRERGLLDSSEEVMPMRSAPGRTPARQLHTGLHDVKRSTKTSTTWTTKLPQNRPGTA